MYDRVWERSSYQTYSIKEGLAILPKMHMGQVQGEACLAMRLTRCRDTRESNGTSRTQQTSYFKRKDLDNREIHTLRLVLKHTQARQELACSEVKEYVVNQKGLQATASRVRCGVSRASEGALGRVLSRHHASEEGCTREQAEKSNHGFC